MVAIYESGLCKGIQVAHGFQIPVHGFRIPNRGSRIPNPELLIPDFKLTGPTEMDPGFHRNLWALNSLQMDSGSKDSHLLDSGFRIPSHGVNHMLSTVIRLNPSSLWVVSYLIERASGLAKRTIERTKIITVNLLQKTIGSTTLYSK